MYTALDVLKVLEVFEATKASKDFDSTEKRLIASELLTLVPHEIMAPGCKGTSAVVREKIKAYLKDTNGTRETKEARHIAQEVPAKSIETTLEGLSPGEAPPNPVVERPGVASVEDRAAKVHKGNRRLRT